MIYDGLFNVEEVDSVVEIKFSLRPTTGGGITIVSQRDSGPGYVYLINIS